MSPPRVAWLGNFEPEWSTENQWRYAFEQHGVEFVAVQQNRVSEREWERIASEADAAALSTTWGWPLPCTEWTWVRLARRGVQTFTAHLDLLWGLPREQLVADRHPQFHGPQHVWTADGAHDDQWAAAGVNHHWLVPAIDERMLGRGTPRDQYRAEIGFVGSRGYHPEWVWREQLIAALHDHYGPRFRHWGGGGEPGVRGPQLADLYASVDVVIGDACFVDRLDRYWSDRVPEVLGRGGFLLHPYQPALHDRYRAGYAWVEPCDLGALFAEIDGWLAEPADRRTVADYGMQLVARQDTWTHRAGEILTTLGLHQPIAA